jgi:hypothetical protein
MKIVLTPDQRHPKQLRLLYERAFREAQELFVATAYLTNWDTTRRVTAKCNRLTFIAGTDFGLTRQFALKQVLKWLPKHGSTVFGAVPRSNGAFHPKMLVWRSPQGACHCVIGSSNLSKAAFQSNFEANVHAQIPVAEYRRLAAWINSVAATTEPITEEWIDKHYHQARLKSGGPKAKGEPFVPVIKLKLPLGARYAACERRRLKQQARFLDIGPRIRAGAHRCADGAVSSKAFWAEFWNLWSTHPSRFQG